MFQISFFFLEYYQKKRMEKKIESDILWQLQHLFPTIDHNKIEEVVQGTNGDIPKTQKQLLIYLCEKNNLKKSLTQNCNFQPTEIEKKLILKRFKTFRELFTWGMYTNWCNIIEISPTQPHIVCIKFIY